MKEERPPKVLLILSDDLLTRIDDFRYNTRIPSRSEAMRRLIEESLERHERPGKKEK